MARPLTPEEQALARKRGGALWWTGMILFGATMALVGWGFWEFLAAAFR